jgi:peptidoglycan hydrolase-like protein with peptidoglycan-binding domain
MKSRAIIIAALATGTLAISSTLAAQTMDRPGDRNAQMQMQAGAQQAQLSEEQVRQLQEALNAEGFDPGPIDGIWGPMTESALRNYQEARGFDATGHPDEETIIALGIEPGAIPADAERHAGLTPEDVRDVQQALSDAAYHPGPVDGVWGPMTEDALRAYQEDKGLQATGQLDSETVEALGLPLSEFAAGEFEKRKNEQR